ncbi:MAG: peptide/nickel transport system ATP-binding protein [Thermotogaceae bacterium]|jgi:peptide/nickel transport system ATP-binding protein/oligopeptide transport system ATP-binding protein|nr:peptide/nickel transport system ATP-binding protein [Thermotogaceae bacterium]MDN5337875.1 peptide/nickel transport system ATP-binding protein [Thermotogaceae bacterium]
MGKNPILKIEKLTKIFKVSDGFFKPKRFITPVNNISFEVREGEALGLVGESGCGKTTTGRLIVKLLQASSGKIIFDGVDITNMKEKEFKKYRRDIQIVFQDPFSSLNPRMTVYQILRRPLRIFNLTSNLDQERELILKTLEEVGLKEEHVNRYPHEFSGGQRQRVAIARAIITNPRFVVLDEPTSALDVSVQAQIMNLLISLKEELRLTYLFISHDLSVVKFISDKIAVMYLGRIVEQASKDEIFNNRLHPYTKLLFDSIPIPDPNVKAQFMIDLGELPSLTNVKPGCPFVNRCEYKKAICERTTPALRNVGNEHYVACYLYHDVEESS